jgi:hypothetical protein
VNVGLVLELLGQVLKTFQPHQLSQEPLLETLLASQEAVPGALDVGDHLALGRHVGRTVGQAEFGLKGVEVRLEFGFLKGEKVKFSLFKIKVSDIRVI